jgi:hypothetical protein
VSEIRINAPGAGEWVMQRAGGFFVPGYGHSLTMHRLEDGGDEILGGFVLDSFTGVCALVHMAGDRPGWATPDLLWMLFDYAFNQLGVKKLLGMVRSDNYTALSLDLRGGWQVETLIRDMYGEGVHAFILCMKPEFCRWLQHVPKGWRVPIRTIVSSDSPRGA